VGVHVRTVDLEALAELDVGAIDDLLKLGLAFDQRRPPEVIAVEVKQVERDQDDLRRCPSARSAGQRSRWCRSRQERQTSPSMIAAGTDVPGIVGDLAEALGPVVAATGVKTFTASFTRWTWTR
jgi:hypothetical protein